MCSSLFYLLNRVYVPQGFSSRQECVTLEELITVSDESVWEIVLGTRLFGQSGCVAIVNII